MSDEITFPLGKRLPRTPYSNDDVIGEVLPTSTGNTSIRIGKLSQGWGGKEGHEDKTWRQTAFITITPEERELLIQELQRHQQDEDRNEDGELEERASYGD